MQNSPKFQSSCSGRHVPYCLLFAKCKLPESESAALSKQTVGWWKHSNAVFSKSSVCGIEEDNVLSADDHCRIQRGRTNPAMVHLKSYAVAYVYTVGPTLTATFLFEMTCKHDKKNI